MASRERLRCRELESRNLISSGALLFGASVALIGMTVAVTGQASPTGVSLLAWVALTGGGLRLLAGAWQWQRSKAASNRGSSLPPADPALAAGSAIVDAVPASLEAAGLTDESQSALATEPTAVAVTPLDYDLWLLGLEPDALFSQVKRAYWTMRDHWANSPSEESPTRLLEVHYAYRRLRRFYEDSGAL